MLRYSEASQAMSQALTLLDMSIGEEVVTLFATFEEWREMTNGNGQIILIKRIKRIRMMLSLSGRTL